ncbi:Succinate-semialdehyde dehydrogenase, mitochondrial [Phytophthora pseudosyringae]|uniref:Succinate-semialdehyde dehydrogenase, mitochondrial n=1 Tax=Phytophthora pseudosyringae TaxID=221518 RepID=A0A8T1VN11_9STRA|nr:Succinate-semialdehyde dehydrogenase, mitochondrial [Phytophthora pseudosyringae]
MNSSGHPAARYHIGQVLQSLRNPELVRSKGYVNGEWVEGRGGECFAVVDPATDEELAQVAWMGQEEAHEAVAAAFVAQRRWKKVTPPDRSAVMKQWHAAIVANAEDLAVIAACESAKPLEEARTEVNFAAGLVEYYAHEIVRCSGYLVTPSDPDKKVLVVKEPVGVCAIMSPWNFPYATVARNLAPCVASGCAAVVKPSGKTPLSLLALAKLAEDAGVPAGVINVVTAPRGTHSGIGKELTENPDVRLVAFTGSTTAGKKLMGQASATVKHVVLELGGNAPFIVFEDADIEKALDGLVAAKFRNSGQTCVTSNRIFVQSNIYDKFVAELVDRVENLKIGLPLEHGVQLGPLIGPDAVEKVTELVDDAVKHGARVLTGGKRSDLGKNFYEAMVLTNVNDKMRIWSEEVFGPVVPLFTFSSEDEVVRKANDTEVGLAGYFYTQDVSRIFRVASKLETGMVAVNAGVVSIVQAPFGGVKESGIGREGALEGLEEYLQAKMVCIGGLS